MKVGMISLMGKPSTRLYSHNAGWTFALIEILKSKGYSQVDLLTQTDDISGYDAICINNGINFTEGAWNFIGGPPKTLVSLLVQLQKFEGNLFSFNAKVDLSDLCNSRKELVMLRNDKFPEVELCNTTQNGPKLIIGDSHSLSIYRPGWGIARNDGKTLFGALKDDGAFIKDILAYRSISDIHLYFGNIDIRFHLARQAAPTVAVYDLAERYYNFACKLRDAGYYVTIQGLIPVEDESRKIPKSGMYYGEPFYGEYALRDELVVRFNEQMAVYCDPSRFVEDGPNVEFKQWSFPRPLPFEKMEARQSVHIRPEHYFFDEFKDTFNPKNK